MKLADGSPTVIISKITSADFNKMIPFEIWMENGMSITYLGDLVFPPNTKGKGRIYASITELPI